MDLVWQGEYLPFGGLRSEMAVAGFSQPLRFPGQYEDDESGLYYNVWRYYDPDTGRYTRTDPLGLLGGDVNLYRYVGGDPVMGVDEVGLMGDMCSTLPATSPPPDNPWDEKKCRKCIKMFKKAAPCGEFSGEQLKECKRRQQIGAEEFCVQFRACPRTIG